MCFSPRSNNTGANKDHESTNKKTRMLFLLVARTNNNSNYCRSCSNRSDYDNNNPETKRGDNNG